MIVSDAIRKSRPGVAERIDSKGQRWAAWIDSGSLTGRIYKLDGEMLVFRETQAAMLKDWTPKDPKEDEIADAVRPKSKGPMWPK